MVTVCKRAPAHLGATLVKRSPCSRRAPRAVYAGQKCRFMFVCGGTSGHVFPAIAVAESLQQKREDAEVLFCCPGDSAESRYIRQYGFNCISAPCSKLTRPFLALQNFFQILRLALAFLRSISMMIIHNPAVVFGTGGYAAFPLCSAAILCRKPLFILEPNSIPGRANIALGFFASRIFTAYATNLSQLPAHRKWSRMMLRIAEKQLLLTVVGGSGGSEELTKSIRAVAPDLLQSFTSLIIHAQVHKRFDLKAIRTDVSRGSSISSRYQETYFFVNMAQQLAASDLVLTRAGAITCAELLQLKVPSVLWPLATATDNHQESNAAHLEALGLSVMFKPQDSEKQTVICNRLLSLLRDLLGDDKKRMAMSKHVELESPGTSAAKQIASYISKVVAPPRE